MTPEDLRAQLEDDRTSRLDELRRLRNVMADMTETQSDEFRRTLVVMTYAHFEGFCKTALLTYVLAVNALKITSSTASPEIVAASWHRRFTRLENPNLKCDIFRRALPDDSQLHRFARRRDFVSELPGFLSTVIDIPDDVVDVESNLTPVVIRKNLFRLGLDPSVVDTFAGNLNELVNRRNSICHGSDRKPVTADEFSRVEATAIAIMEKVMLAVSEGFTKGVFAVHPGHVPLIAS